MKSNQNMTSEIPQVIDISCAENKIIWVLLLTSCITMLYIFYIFMLYCFFFYILSLSIISCKQIKVLPYTYMDILLNCISHCSLLVHFLIQ